MERLKGKTRNERPASAPARPQYRQEALDAFYSGLRRAGMPEPWTLIHWQRVFNDQVFLHSVWNTFLLAGGTALSAVGLFKLIGCIVVRTRFVGRSALDVISWLPSTYRVLS